MKTSSNDGAFITAIGCDDGPGRLRVPCAVALDRNDNVFVTDWGGSRVLKFAPV
jgi:hypothetical protein